jgi:alpha-L-fucosidase 2
MQAMTPPLPIQVESGVRRLMPAEKFSPKRSNVENVELYAIWPFGLLGVGRQNLDLAIDTFRRRPEKASIGWQYDGQSAAAVGLAEEAAALLVGKAGNSNPKHRFPAMWGPNYDWLPDQDHGSNIMLTLQAMLIRPVGDKIYLLPAWPKTWSARFKLHAPARTVIEAEVRNGELVDLQVTPASRRRDVILSGR